MSQCPSFRPGLSSTFRGSVGLNPSLKNNHFFCPRSGGLGHFKDSGAGADLCCAPAPAPAPLREGGGTRGGGEHRGWGILKTWPQPSSRSAGVHRHACVACMGLPDLVHACEDSHVVHREPGPQGEEEGGSEGQLAQRLLWVTPPLGTRGPALAAGMPQGQTESGGIVHKLFVWPCGTRFSNTQEGLDRCRSAPITGPLWDPEPSPFSLPGEGEGREREGEGGRGREREGEKAKKGTSWFDFLEL